MKPHAVAIHAAIKAHDVAQVAAILQADRSACNSLDEDGLTPLMQTASSRVDGVEVLTLLIDAGADVHRQTQSEYGGGMTALSFASRRCDTEKIAFLIQCGADPSRRGDGGTTMLTYAAFGESEMSDAQLTEAMALLLKHRADIDAANKYGESPLRHLARIGRFKMVGWLLAAGADITKIAWTKLMLAVALGSLSKVELALAQEPELEAKDWWSRTAWLLAVQSGDIEKASLLLQHGASSSAQGRCGKTALAYAIEGRSPQMLRWLLEIGVDVEQKDEFGKPAIFEAVEGSDAVAVRVLLDAGASVSHPDSNVPLMYHARDGAIIRMLLDAGCDETEITHEGKRSLLGLRSEPERQLLGISKEQFGREHPRRFGASNPEEFDVPFWQEMIRTGMNAYLAAKHFDLEAEFSIKPIWCAERFGQSITFLPDGRIILIGGEHEDSYDPDFCIYNDVWVRECDGRIRIFGYPRDVFPPTDFHSATLVGDAIYVIGRLGYIEDDDLSSSKIYRLDTTTYCFTAIETKGEGPRQLSRHRARLIADRQIRVEGGQVWQPNAKAKEESPFDYVLDLDMSRWSKVPAGAA